MSAAPKRKQLDDSNDGKISSTTEKDAKTSEECEQRDKICKVDGKNMPSSTTSITNGVDMCPTFTDGHPLPVSSGGLLSGVAGLLEFMMLIGQLKRVRRSGWVNHNVQNVESDGDHMYRMAVLAFLFNPTDDGVDREKCMKLALVHDMAECLVGDLTPFDGVSREEKHTREKQAMAYIRDLVSGDVGAEIYDLWYEYEMNSSAESAVVHELDKFDMILQAYEYEKLEDRPGELQQFFDSTRNYFSNPKVTEWVAELHRMRDKYMNVKTTGTGDDVNS